MRVFFILQTQGKEGLIQDYVIQFFTLHVNYLMSQHVWRQNFDVLY